MDLYRFYVPDLRAQAPGGVGGVGGVPVSLPGDQAHHALSVLRLHPGDKVVLFDGQGAWAEATLDRVAKSGGGGVAARITGDLQVESPPELLLTLATAVPKGERAEWLVEQASQLNAAAVQWVACDRSVVKPREGGGKMDKWRRLALESAKQCGRAHIMEIREMAALIAVVSAAGIILWLDPAAGGMGVADALGAVRTGSVTALIGPEGGWSNSERHMLESAVQAGKIKRVRLTQTVLRIETACAAVAAVAMSK